MSFEFKHRPPVALAMGDDNGAGFKWLADNGSPTLPTILILGLLGVWVASATAPFVYRMTTHRKGKL